MGGTRPQGYVEHATRKIDPLGLQARDAQGKFLSKEGQNLAGPGKLFEESLTDQFRAKGDQVFRNVTVRDAQGNIVSYADMIVVREGKVKFVVEAKSGRKELSDGQRGVRNALRDGEPLNFTGDNAQGIPGAGNHQTYPGVQYQRLGPGDPIP